MRSWCSCSLDDDDAPQRPVSISHEPQRSSASKRKWCTPDLEDLKPEGPRSTGRSSGPRSTGRSRKSLVQQWCTLSIDEDAEVPPARGRGWQQLDLQDDVPGAAHAARKKGVSLSASTLTFLSNVPKKKVLNSYDKNGMDAERIRSALRGCKCKGPCTRQFTFEEIYDLCRLYHSMLESDRQFLLHTMYTNEAASQVRGPSGHGPRPRQQWYILGRHVCVPGFVALLGISEKKLYKDIRLAIDGRRSLDDNGPIHPRNTPQLDLCHHFFRQLYTSAAEVLPTRPPQTHGPGDSSGDEFDELDGWTPDKFEVDIVGDSLGEIDPKHLTVRQLPLWSMADLYWQFQAWFESQVLRGAEAQEEDGPEGDEPQGDGPVDGQLRMPARRTFARAWYGPWSQVLRLKFPSDHSYCQTCFDLRERTYRTWAPLHEKLHYARRWRDHLRDQYLDRVLYWNLRFLSRRFDSTVLVIIIDSMDRKKAVWPKWDFNRRPHEIEQLKPRPRMTVTGGMAHGWCTAIYIAQETLSHGSNAYVEVLCQLLDEVARLCRVHGRRFPVHLVLQADNTVAQTKNQYASGFCSQLVGMQKFCTVTMNFLMVGHTHEDIDQLFALICQYVIRRHRWQTPEEFKRLVREALSDRIAEKGEVLVVQGLRCIRDYSTWLAPQQVAMFGCWGNRDGFESPHSFAFKKRSDLSAEELAQVQGRRGVAESADDVFCCVKAYMRDKRLQQPPVLVLPVSRRDRVQGRPNTVEPIRMSDDRAAQLEAMADIIEGDMYRYNRAALELRNLARSRAAPPVPAPGWLEEPPGAQAPVVPAGNEYFGHLPDISWHMHARFHRI